MRKLTRRVIRFFTNKNSIIINGTRVTTSNVKNSQVVINGVVIIDNRNEK